MMAFSTNDISALLNSFVSPTGATRTPNPELDSDDFLTLLVAQLQNQDPLSPMDQQEFLSELSQFNILQQNIDLNDAFMHFMQFQELTQATSLIGKEIIALTEGTDGEVYSSEGQVVEVYFTTAGAILRLDDDTEVSIQDIVNVKIPED
jgi:flagellar basal-body rod modification protein FlgD